MSVSFGRIIFFWRIRHGFQEIGERGRLLLFVPVDDDDESFEDPVKNNNDDDDDSVKTGAATKKCCGKDAHGILRQTAITSFVFAAVIVPLVVFIFARTDEVQSFEQDYDALASTVVAGVRDRLVQILLALDAVGLEATSQTSNQTWPNVNIRDFDLLAIDTTGHISFFNSQDNAIPTADPQIRNSSG